MTTLDDGIIRKPWRTGRDRSAGLTDAELKRFDDWVIRATAREVREQATKAAHNDSLEPLTAKDRLVLSLIAKEMARRDRRAAERLAALKREVDKLEREIAKLRGAS